MIFDTLNVRGVGGTLKYLSCKRFLDLEKPDVLLIHETMVCEEKERELFMKLLPNCYFYGVDSIGLSGGLLIAWNPRKVCYAFLNPAWILLDGVVKDLNKSLKLLN